MNLVLSETLLATVFGKPQWDEMLPSGQWGATGADNLEQQKYCWALVVAGTLLRRQDALAAGLRGFDFAFQHQADDGGFPYTRDPFHQVSFFSLRCAQACLTVPAIASRYREKLRLAADWTTRSTNWQRGVANDAKYSHRFWLNAACLQLVGELLGEETRYASFVWSQTQLGLQAQTGDGWSPEAGGYDSSYQGVQVSLAQLLPPTPAISRFCETSLAWLRGRVLADGSIDCTGNSRVGPGSKELGPGGKPKESPDWRSACTALATAGDEPTASLVAFRYFNR